MINLLADPALFDATELRVEGDTFVHFFRARRVAAGEEMRVVDGRGHARWGKVGRVDRTSATVTLGDPAPSCEPAFRLDLLVPTCRPERASWLVEKATEVGVAAVRFLNMARAPREPGSGSIDRLRRVAAAAVEQCHRSVVPEVTGPHAWNEIGRIAGSGPRWFLDTEAAVGAALRGRPGGVQGGIPDPPGGPNQGGPNQGDPNQGGHIGPPLRDSSTGSGSEGTGSLLVGPEGGLAPEERRDLLSAGWQPTSLGDRILRLETAAVVSAAFLLLHPNF